MPVGSIIVFAREPVPGRTKTRLIPLVGAVNAALLADAFLKDTLAKVKTLGGKLLIAASARGGTGNSRYFQSLAKTYGADLIDQIGADLGVRMARALAQSPNQAGVIIGSDIPSLPALRLKCGLRLLSESDLVIGPALDGGYFLVGGRGATSKIFGGIEWGGPQVFEQTVDRVHQAGIRYARAPFWYDVDSGTDLLLLSAHVSGRGRLGASLQACMPLGRSCPCPATAKLLRDLGL